MGTRLINLVIDSSRPQVVANFWAELLGWKVAIDLPEEVDVRTPASDGWDLDLAFVPVSEVKAVKNRIHLDLASSSIADQKAIVDKALRLGARPALIGQREVPWVVLADPDGNEFCVLEPRAKYLSTGAIAAIVVDAHDPLTLASFWADVTGWTILDREQDIIVGLRTPSGRGPWLEFLRSRDVKKTKNRVHLDVAPPPGEDLAEETARLTELGAAPAGRGGLDLPWEVLTDPEGNEFCVLSAR
jgi:predicted enzyme related to lactoylglutathione lyase